MKYKIVMTTFSGAELEASFEHLEDALDEYFWYLDLIERRATNIVKVRADFPC